MLVDDNYGIFLNPQLLSCKQDNQCTCNVTMRRVHVTIVAVESKKFYIFVCECTLACVSPGAKRQHVFLLIQHVTRMRHIVTSFVAPPRSAVYFDII